MRITGLGGIDGKTIYLVKVGDDIIEKTFSIKEAKETVQDFNFEITRGLKKAKLFKATIKLKKK